MLSCSTTIAPRLESAQTRRQEILVASFDGSPSGIPIADWCGNRALVVRRRYDLGVIWIDLLQKKRVQISTDGQDSFYGCTFDGAWVVYSDYRSIRTDRGSRPAPSSKGPDWNGEVVDLWRYELATGRRQRFAVVRARDGYQAMAPSAYRIFLGARHNSSIPMPVPRWEAFWADNEWSDLTFWSNSTVAWLKDSLGIVQPGFIKIFGKDGWEARFLFGDSLDGHVDTDASNRIYMLFKQDLPGGKEHWPLSRCNLARNGPVGCTVLHKDAGIFVVLPTGEIIFEDEADKCLRRYTPGRGIGECVVLQGSDAFLHVEAVSPDGRWLAFTRVEHERGPADLFVLPLDGR